MRGASMGKTSSLDGPGALAFLASLTIVLLEVLKGYSRNRRWHMIDFLRELANGCAWACFGILVVVALILRLSWNHDKSGMAFVLSAFILCSLAGLAGLLFYVAWT